MVFFIACYRTRYVCVPQACRCMIFNVMYYNFVVSQVSDLFDELPREKDECMTYVML